MIHKVNPQEKGNIIDMSGKQTVELRSPDGSADIYMLLAGLTVAARHGFELKNPLEVANNTYVDINIFDEENKKRQEQLAQLPTSCVQSAKNLHEQRQFYTQHDIFPDRVIDHIITKLTKFNDEGLITRIQDDEDEVMTLVNQYFNCG